jgi:hypothetical protein
MLPANSSKTSPAASRTTRDRVVDAGFHASVGLLGLAIVAILAFLMHHPG